MAAIGSFLIAELLAGYNAGRFTPIDVIDHALERAEQTKQRNVWITRLSREQLLPYIQTLAARSIDELPLFGIPFVIKDNIDLAGTPTTAGCPEFSYLPRRSACVVQRLIDAGAIPLGKTNLDQFATGLVGTRSPYGACQNSFNSNYIAGGSSSGSAVAVATGLASFALGTDTAGSGRVPAAFNNIVGLKPSFGRLSTRGLIPACRSLDCVSIFSLTTEDAARVLSVAEAFDAEDPYSRPVEDKAITHSRIGIPRRDQLNFFGDEEYSRQFEQAVKCARSLGLAVIDADIGPLLEAARLLYDGPWVAERYAALEAFMQSNADTVFAVTRGIIEKAQSLSAVEAFKAQYRLMALKRCADALWADIDALMVPTAGTIFTISQINADPIVLNSKLGYYTNAVNLLDLAAIAIPGGFRNDGLPFGITVIGQRSTDRALIQLGSRLHSALVHTLGALELPFPEAASAPASVVADGFTTLAVCGAHMQGLPLNHELLDRGGYLIRKARTAANYRLYALPGSFPPRPGLIRVSAGGAPIDVEVWAIRASEFGSFLNGIPAPLGIGNVKLHDGDTVPGFLCESYAVEDAADITTLGGWRAYLRNHQPLNE